jgi:prepilin-type processing-associated H-X9-DG protein
LTYEQRVEKLKKGALYRYLQNPKVYRCPEGAKDLHRTYSIPLSMNANSDYIAEGTVYKRTGEIKKASERLVFIEEVRMTPDGLQICANAPQWQPYPDWPGAVHDNATTVGMADGHCELWKWQCEETIGLISLVKSPSAPPNFSTYTNPSCKKDVIKFQLAVWGNSIGYNLGPYISDMP